MNVVEEAWNFQCDRRELEKNIFCEYKLAMGHGSKQIAIGSELHGFHTQNLNYSGSAAKNIDYELKTISKTNKQLVQETKSTFEEYEQLKAKYSKVKSEQTLLAEEIKDTYETFLMAKKKLRKALKFHFTIEPRNDGKHGILLQFFTITKESKGYSVYLLRDSKTKHYEVLQISPGQEICKEVQKKLQATNDVPGALCYIRQHFLKIKQGKKADSLE